MQSALNQPSPRDYLAGTVSEDWYATIFDQRYHQVDRQRKPATLTLREVDWLETLFPDNSPPLAVLDLGCGYGRHLIELSKRGHRVTGIDQSSALLAIAQQRARETGVDVALIEGDYRDLPPDRFDLVLLMHTSFGYLPSPGADESFFCSILSHLRSGGALVLQERQPASLPSDPTVDEEYDVDGRTTYRRVSVYSPALRLWRGVYVYMTLPNRDEVILPFRIHLHGADTFGRWAASCGPQFELSVVEGPPDSPAEDIFLIRHNQK